MNPQELVFKAQNIAKHFVDNGSDMNAEMAKLASQNKLNDEQICRLVEEGNKAAFLLSLEKTGKQIFEVASLEGVKDNMKPVEKVAVESFAPIEKADPVMDEIRQFLSTKKMEKIASDVSFSEGFLETCADGFTKIAQYIELVELAAKFEEAGQKRYGYGFSGESLVKVAERHNNTHLTKLGEILEELPYASDRAVLGLLNIFEHAEGGEFIKQASMIWGNTNPMKAGMTLGERAGAVVNATAKGVVGVPLALAGKGAGLAVKGGLAAATALAPATAILGKSPIQKVFNAMMLKHEGGKLVNFASKKGITSSRFVGEGVEQLAKHASEMEKVAFLGAALNLMKPMLPGIAEAAGGMMMKSAPSMMGRALSIGGKIAGAGQSIMGAKPFQKLAEENDDFTEKLAGWREGLQHVLDFVIPGATMGWAGIAAATAKKLGGGIALTMNQRDLEQSFDTIIKHNPEFNGRETQARQYFDVIARNAPSLAKDPLVAGNLVKNFDALGGVDFNTVKSLRETESLAGGGSDSKGLSGLAPIKL